MRPGVPLEGGVLAVGFGIGTWVAGWWTVPVLAFAWGASQRAPWLSGASAAAAWGVLLATDWGSGALARLAGRLGGTLHVPGFTLLLTTLVFAAGLGWAGARLGSAIRAWRRS